MKNNTARAGAGGRGLGTRIVPCPHDGKPIEVPAYVGDWISTQIKRGNLEEVHRDAELIVSKLMRKVMGQGLSIAPFQFERVQPSTKSSGIPDHVLDAQTELQRIAAFLGKRQFNLLRSVVIDGLNASSVSTTVMGDRAPWGRKEAAGRIREALEDVIEMYGLRQNSRPRMRSVVSERPTLALPDDADE
jgi:hypothetical protein